jgi:hypothetical protein
MLANAKPVKGTNGGARNTRIENYTLKILVCTFHSRSYDIRLYVYQKTICFFCALNRIRIVKITAILIGCIL